MLASDAVGAQLMRELRSGNDTAAGRLVELFHPELRRIAAAQMRGERINHTWQATVLVNELYLELRRIKSLPPGTPDDQEEKAAFLRLSAFLMKRMLIHHARPLAKRSPAVPLSEAPEPAVDGEQELADIERTLSRLAEVDPVLRTVVEMKVFEGSTREQIAEALGCSVRTVASHWSFAQQWLRQAVEDWNPARP